MDNATLGHHRLRFCERLKFLVIQSGGSFRAGLAQLQEEALSMHAWMATPTPRATQNQW